MLSVMPLCSEESVSRSDSDELAVSSEGLKQMFSLQQHSCMNTHFIMTVVNGSKDKITHYSPINL